MHPQNSSDTDALGFVEAIPSTLGSVAPPGMATAWRSAAVSVYIPDLSGSQNPAPLPPAVSLRPMTLPTIPKHTAGQRPAVTVGERSSE